MADPSQSSQQSPEAQGGAAPRVLPIASPHAAEQLGQGLYDFLLPVVTECDERVKEVFASQAALSEQIDSLSTRTCSLRHSGFSAFKW
jgi:hypothetical protein